LSPGAPQFSHGGGSDGAALTSPTPNVKGAMPTPAAIAAAAAMRFTSMFVPSEISASTS